MSTANTTFDHNKVIDATRDWLQGFVIELNLCPFAANELAKNRIRFVVSDATKKRQLLADLLVELELLDTDQRIETTLLIHPGVLQDFYEYNDFLGAADDFLIAHEREGIYQVASFHPNYQFADTSPDDVENYTNRSPYPMLHLIREDSLDKAIANYPDTEKIPVRNITLLRSLGIEKIQALMATTAKPDHIRQK